MSANFTLKSMADEAVAALLADPFISAIPALSGAQLAVSLDEGDIQNAITQSLNKIGLNVTVSVMSAATRPNIPGPYFDDIALVAVVTEETTVNRNINGGANPDGYELTAAVAAILHQLGIDGGILFSIDRIARVLNAPDGQNVWNIFFSTEGGFSYQRQAIAPVTATVTPGTEPGTSNVVFKCATPGAPIWFVTDDTYPSPLNPTSQIYLPYAAVLGSDVSGNPLVSSDGGVLVAGDVATVQPLNLPAGTKLKARAWLAGYAPADPQELSLTL